MRKKIIYVVLFFILTGTFVNAEEAASIVERSRSRITAATTMIHYTMLLTAKNGSTREQREMYQYSKKDSQGNNRTVINFRAPDSVKGSRFLTIERPGQNNDQRIFLPKEGTVRRLAGSAGSRSFLNTDFSHDDISSADRNPDLDNHKLLREEKLKDRDCYVIESTPKDTDYQYSKMIQWIDKNNFVNYKVELYDKRGTQVKLLEILQLREVQGRLAPVVTRMTTLADGTSTTLNAVNLKYDDPIPEGVFTDRYLLNGRP